MAACSTRTASRSPRRWSRSGSATRPAAITIPATSTTRRSIPTSTAAAAIAPTTSGRYEFITIKPGAYPWKNHHNAWRPAHIHFSLFGPAFATRLITQMYFPDDPLLAYDPIYNSVPAGARKRLQAAFDMETTRPEWALAYKFDIVLRGRNATPME